MTLGASEAETPGDKDRPRWEIVDKGEMGGGGAISKRVRDKAGDVEMAARQTVEVGTERKVVCERHIGGRLGCCHVGHNFKALFIFLA